MTAGNHGNGTPESDDPFAYLYRSEGGGAETQDAGGEGAAVAQPGVPRTSYNQVQRVGERRPQPGQGGGYGYPQSQQPQQSQQQSGYGYPPPAQAEPQYDRQPPQPSGRRAGGGHGARAGGPVQGGPNRKGLLIGAIAVVAAVAVVIILVMANGGDTKGDTADNGPSPTVTASGAAPSRSTSPTQDSFDSKPVDAATLAMAGGAKSSTQWPGASAANGTYVDGMTGPGASVTWTVQVPQDGAYTYFVSYGNAGEDAGLTLAVNGAKRDKALNMKNWGHATDWSKAWHTTTFAWVDLKKGANTLTLSCEPGDKCGVNLDQVWLKEGQVQK